MKKSLTTGSSTVSTVSLTVQYLLLLDGSWFSESLACAHWIAVANPPKQPLSEAAAFQEGKRGAREYTLPDSSRNPRQYQGQVLTIVWLQATEKKPSK